MKTINLFYLKNDSIKVEVTAKLADGSLTVEGYDIGKAVLALTGDSDYEYSITLNQAETEKLYQLFNIQHGDEDKLLNELQKRFHGNYSFSSFKTFLADKMVKYDYFSWN